MDKKLARLCARLGLGDMTAPPVDVRGGYLHRMLRVETERGNYAVKALNPDIMRRPEALGNMRRGEQAALALQGVVPVVAALDGAVMEVGGAWFIVYPWVEGRSVFPPHITPEHCRLMGDVLGRIHASGVRVEGMQPAVALREPFDWALTEDPAVPLWDAQTLQAQARLLDTQVISHRDLDPKNVLWQDGRPLLIDWEAAGYVNPWQELIELLGYWAADEACTRALIDAWAQHMDVRTAPWEDALQASFDGMLGWLHYSLRRAAGLEGSGEKDRREGEAQAGATLEELHRHAGRIARMRQWLPV